VVEWVWIGAGGAVGAMARHGVGLGAKLLLGEHFPWGTLAVNALGSLLLGVLIELFAREGGVTWLSPEARRMLTTGGLGAFTTFSTFSVQTVHLAERGDLGLAAANVGANVLLGLTLAYGGVLFARAVL